jgi:hypothetical protein
VLLFIISSSIVMRSHTFEGKGLTIAVFDANTSGSLAPINGIAVRIIIIIIIRFYFLSTSQDIPFSVAQ